MQERLNWDEYACLLAYTASLRSEDPDTKVGCCVLNQYKQVIALGYNGLLTKQEYPDEAKGNREEKRVYFIHAETNALSLVKKGEALILGLTHSPCLACAKNIAAHGIKQVYYITEYHAEDTFKKYFDKCGIGYKQLSVAQLDKMRQKFK